MVNEVTEELLRKSAEHNEGIISTLEELALHQRDIEKIEHLDKWCRDLKILDLTSNLIEKIENLAGLKKLEYLKLGLNNIERIENLEGCESLNKLDMTVNFVGELISIENLTGLIHLKDIYLTGNPCTQFENYREFVIATLPQLEKLDGLKIEKSERILAQQILHEIRPYILEQQNNYKTKREKERDINEKKNSESVKVLMNQDDIDLDIEEKRFWSEPSDFTPESRKHMHNHLEKFKEKRENKKLKPIKEERKLVNHDGKPFNINEPKVPFKLKDDEIKHEIVLDIAIFKYLDTDQCKIDIQPNYIQVLIKGKMLQLVLPEEVNTDQCTAQRSQVSGHLVITMPKVNAIINPYKRSNVSKKYTENKKSKDSTVRYEKLEIDPNFKKKIQLENIYNEAISSDTMFNYNKINKKQNKIERPNSIEFIDDLSIPPLE